MQTNWRLGVALVIVWAYGYQLLGWPVLVWLMALLTIWTDIQWPSPTLLPWEHLIAGTTTLATISGMDIARDKLVPPERQAQASKQSVRL